jgi:hypothetical protein
MQFYWSYLPYDRWNDTSSIQQQLQNSCTVIKIYIYLNTYLLTLPLFAGVSRVRALSPAWTRLHALETLISRTHLLTAGTKNKSIKKILILVDIFGRKKTPENNFIINRIFKSFVQIMGKIYFIFHWNLHERDPFFVCIKGKQLLWECAKTYFREKLQIYLQV